MIVHGGESTGHISAFLGLHVQWTVVLLPGSSQAHWCWELSPVSEFKSHRLAVADVPCIVLPVHPVVLLGPADVIQ